MRYLNLLLLVGISFLPLYMWSSGGLQASHFFLILYSSVFLWSRGIGYGKADLFLLLLLTVEIVRESFSVFSGASIQTFMPAVHLLFCLIIFNVFRRIFESEKILQIMIAGFIISVGIAVFGVLFIGYSLSIDEGGSRAIGTFNNPNQLGYFSVCIFSIAFLLNLDKKISNYILILLIVSSIFLCVASLSKAAMISIGLPLTFVVFYIFKGRGKFGIGLLLFGLLILSIWYFYSTGILEQYSFFERLKNIGSQDDDNLEERGYGAIFQASVVELFFGFGYAGTTSVVGHEVHSTVFSFLAGYGLIGVTLFVTFLYFWALKVWRTFHLSGLFMIVFPPLVYGIAHNGSRFTIFWILLALSFAVCSKRKLATRYKN